MIWISVDYRSFDWDLFVEEKRERENVDILGLNYFVNVIGEFKRFKLWSG